MTAQTFEIVIFYTTGLVARLSVKGRTEWKSCLRALRHAEEFKRQHPKGWTKIEVLPA